MNQRSMGGKAPPLAHHGDSFNYVDRIDLTHALVYHSILCVQVKPYACDTVLCDSTGLNQAHSFCRQHEWQEKYKANLTGDLGEWKFNVEAVKYAARDPDRWEEFLNTEAANLFSTEGESIKAFHKRYVA
eukprot:TRINITY_DN556_c0_g1_i3.p1 TRINITY_DN556_c0_g1~~TRINITY_DN556_c0_g1_i3.p1  ORF type:complete len:130 (-),score=4.47 TRINITY_DN556_c0_g1_i3:210-599(-)